MKLATWESSKGHQIGKFCHKFCGRNSFLLPAVTQMALSNVHHAPYQSHSDQMQRFLLFTVSQTLTTTKIGVSKTSS